jgi:hypothetical protein
METFTDASNAYEEEHPEPSEEEQRLRNICFRVMHKCCQQCLFGPEKLVSDERKADILAQCERQEKTFFVCHEGSSQGKLICCRAFFERYKDQLLLLRLVQLYERRYPGSIRFVNPIGEEDQPGQDEREGQ